MSHLCMPIKLISIKTTPIYRVKHLTISDPVKMLFQLIGCWVLWKICFFLCRVTSFICIYYNVCRSAFLNKYSISSFIVLLWKYRCIPTIYKHPGFKHKTVFETQFEIGSINIKQSTLLPAENWYIWFSTSWYMKCILLLTEEKN